MAGEYWRCTRCGVAFRLVGEPAGCANDMCASSSFEPVVVLPVAEYERMIRERDSARAALAEARAECVEDRPLSAIAVIDRAVLGEEKL